MDFTKWLTQQQKRDDVIGDISRDFVASGDTSLEEGRLHGGALRAYERALSEFAVAQVFA